ncbi:MAG: ATP-binding protein [Myxococcaceae bacterium]
MNRVQTGDRTSKHILVVDDDVDIRATLSDFLEDEGYIVAAAANGREALAYLREHPSTSVILLDLMMPVMDGVRFRAEQKNDPKVATIPVVVMTARGAVDPGSLDVQDVIAKPLDLRKLVGAIHRASKRDESRSANGAGAALAPDDFIAGGGEMGALMRSMDWSKTELGAMGDWPVSLRTVAGLLLRSGFPMLLWWGPNLIQLYNDAYRPILGDKHPRSLGAPGAEVWKEIWPVVGPLAESIQRGGPATWNEHLLLPINRKGFLEETYFTFSFSPVPEQGGKLGGVLVTCQETTHQVLGERRLRTLQTIAAASIKAKEAEEVARLALQAVASNPNDVPFALLYLLDKSGERVWRQAVVGVDEKLAGPPSLPLNDAESDWPFQEALRTRRPVEIPQLSERLQPLLRGSGAPSPTRGMVLPIEGAPGVPLAGFLVLGLSVQLEHDENYRGFLELVAGHLSSAIQNARAYEEEKKRAEALAEIDRVKTAFFSNVSHEFRTPLTLMLGLLEDQLNGARGPLPSAVREDVEVVHRNAVRLLKLVSTLLDFSRLEAGRIQAVYAPTDLSRLTVDLVSVFRSATDKAGLSLKVDCPPLPEKVYVDREMWEKIVLNLVSNAFKFTLEGEVAVSLRWDNGAVALQVRDTGTGIPAGDLPHIFDRFHRVQGARARTHEGSGIGLALVHELVKLHRGTVRAESRMGEGTTFVVSIPTGTAHLPKDRIEASSTSASTSVGRSAFIEEALNWLPEGDKSSPPLEGEPASDIPAASSPAVPIPDALGEARILVADDNADMREYVRRLLSQHWDVEVVSNGAAALSAARTRPPALVLTDVMMPELDGFGLLRELRADPKTRTVPLIMLSARAGEEARVEGLEAGADDYISKPFSARELMARVGSQLALAKVRREAKEAEETRLAEMERTVRFAEMFVGILGHDLRNPLFAINTAASTLLRRSEGLEKVSKPALRILTSAERMRRMIDQLLDFTRARLGSGIPLQRSSTDLVQVCRAVKDEFEGSAVQLFREGDTKGEWDRDRLAQLLSNLLANALGHGPSGSQVTVKLDGSRPDVVRLEVHNQGVIPPDLLPVLFEPFRTGDKKLSRSSGLGLGLFITRQIALAHAGSIRVESSESGGTCFIVELPRKGAETGLSGNSGQSFSAA